MSSSLNIRELRIVVFGLVPVTVNPTHVYALDEVAFMAELGPGWVPRGGPKAALRMELTHHPMP